MDWRKALAYITGTVDDELQLRHEYLSAENRILIQQLQGRLRLTDPQRQTLAEIGHRLGRKALADVANIVRPETILSSYCRASFSLAECCSVFWRQNSHLSCPIFVQCHTQTK